MLVLFEHGTAKGPARVLSGHTIQTAQAKGWDTLSNGALLNAAEEAGFKLRQHQVVPCSATCRAYRCSGGFRDAW